MDRKGSRARGATTPKTIESVRFPLPPGELLAKGLAELALPAREGEFSPVAVSSPERLVPLLNRYLDELALFNAAFDLVATDTGSEAGRADLVVRHVLDSLAPWKEVARELSRRADPASDSGGAETAQVAASGTGSAPSLELADAGSGAGFPGIPLALLFPSIRVTLIERMSKRCAFLENCVALLGLSNVSVLNAEVERAPRGAFDVVVFRAFRPLERPMLGTLLSLARDGTAEREGGCLAAWKARRERIEEEMKGVSDCVGRWEARPVSVPFLGHEERNLVVIEKKAIP
jgi:16S rRNA (guanine527-N7)-methyltransferase